MRRSVLAVVSVTGCAFGLWLASGGLDDAAFGQAGRTRPRDAGNANTGVLDVRANEVLKTFANEAATLSLEYQKAGEYAKAKDLLENVIAVFPEAEGGLKERIKQLDEQLLTSNDSDIEVDVSKNWTTPVAQVFKGKPVRIQVSPNSKYKFVANTLVGPEGFPTENPAKGDMVGDVPCGMLMGLVASQGQKEVKPFAVGGGKDFTPEEDGLLFLGVNVPPGHKCTGKLKVTLSGVVARP